ncbi:PLP-dependent aminotransferase family protein [Ruegeria atlantica]|uniref:MocR-like pyridoxine biosynthesis transcription factor PdxR n=1 Tax=Ruegeria atlantica TaxID=81569 RepID=UPI00147BE9A6|nr:PLP-dependent aminotransferase family protein [Ruegeria atlantica]
MKHTPWLAFSIDRSAKTPVFEQICAAIRARTISGDLAEGTKLPPTRVFATELGVSRSTVVTAYEQLVAEGYLNSLQGSGYTVCALGEVELTKHVARKQPKSVEEQLKTPMPFEASHPDMRLFPHRQWAKTVARVCRTNPETMLSGSSVFGNGDLREAIAEHVSEWRGIDAAAHHIIVTAGSIDAIEICLRSLVGKGEAVGLENPGYLPVRRLANAQGLGTTFLDVDENGARLPDRHATPKLAVLTPSHQYPLGGAMSPSRRLDFLAWAERNHAWIIEDDYDSEFRYAGRPIPAMAGFDQLNRAIYIGSFSKIFSNSLRLGYIVAPDALLDRIRTTLNRFGSKASYMPQQALAEFMKSGEFYRHLRRMRRIYDERRKFLLEKLKRDFMEFGHFINHHAGMQIVFHLNSDFEDTKIAMAASEMGIAVRPLSRLSVGNSGRNGLILGFCGCSEEEMEPALMKLRTCFVR